MNVHNFPQFPVMKKTLLMNRYEKKYNLKHIYQKIKTDLIDR